MNVTQSCSTARDCGSCFSVHFFLKHVAAEIEDIRGRSMGVSDPEVRKKLSEPRWLHFKHESEKKSWPWWRRLMHRLQRCPACKREKVKNQ
jgi:hypothetical protein